MPARLPPGEDADAADLEEQPAALHCDEGIDRYLRPMDRGPLFWLNRNCVMRLTQQTRAKRRFAKEQFTLVQLEQGRECSTTDPGKLL